MRVGLALACVVAAATLPLQAHDLYSHLKDAAGGSCCDDRDCRPAPYRFIADNLQMFVDGRWIDVPMTQVQYRALLGDSGTTDGGHWCGSTYEPDASGLNRLYITKCAVLPPRAASAEVGWLGVSER